MRKDEFENTILAIDNESFEMNNQIKYVRIINDLAIAILKFDNLVSKYRQFNNCEAFDTNGNLIWIAEHPTTISDFTKYSLVKINEKTN